MAKESSGFGSKGNTTKYYTND
nr:hypothetical protein [Tanacetum cinerariifolium]